ncbi:MAG: hypothetical protein WD734_00540, partial [Dehalococcoidia bacterium]
IKQVDLFRILLNDRLRTPMRPRIFQVSGADVTERDLLSLMMPFRAEFDAVHAAVRDAADELAMRCFRVDDIWHNDAVIQDVVSLIERSQIVVCDCTGKNPNVFYEAGIAHTMGRDVILIAQSADDIPFDLRPLRYVRYLNNNEGRATLHAHLVSRARTIIGAS